MIICTLKNKQLISLVERKYGDTEKTLGLDSCSVEAKNERMDGQ